MNFWLAKALLRAIFETKKTTSNTILSTESVAYTQRKGKLIFQQGYNLWLIIKGGSKKQHRSHQQEQEKTDSQKLFVCFSGWFTFPVCKILTSESYENRDIITAFLCWTVYICDAMNKADVW